MEPRACVARWDGDKLTVYTPTGGIANCRTDMARDLGIPHENVRVVCQYMGGNFGNKNQNQDADLIAAMLAKEAGAPVKLELSRKEDFIGVHGRWPTAQYYKVGVKQRRHAAGDPAARLQRHGSVPQEFGQRSAASSFTSARTSRRTSHPVYTNRTVSANFRGPEFPQGFFGIQSMMDDVAYKLKMDPVEFVAEEHDAEGRRRDAVHQLHARRVHPPRRGGVRLEEALAVRSRGRTPGRSSAARACRSWRSAPALGPQQRGDPARREGPVHACTSASPTSARGAKTTMGLIAAEALGVPLSKSRRRLGRHRPLPVLGGRVRQPHDDHDRLRGGRSRARSEEADRREGHAEGRRRADRVGDAESDASQGKVRSAFGAHFVEVEVDTELGRVRVTQVSSRCTTAAAS